VKKIRSNEEKEFRKWYTHWATIMGINLDPDFPEHFYDYRKAFRAGANPKYDKATGKYHWPSKFKKPKHPNRFIKGVDTIRNKSISKITKEKLSEKIENRRIEA